VSRPLTGPDEERPDGVRGYALDPEATERLWDVSLRMLETSVTSSAESR
jgi:hypothetical protein